MGNTPLCSWSQTTLQRAKRNLVVVALANKLARIAWAFISRRRSFDVNLRPTGEEFRPTRNSPPAARLSEVCEWYEERWPNG